MRSRRRLAWLLAAALLLSGCAAGRPALRLDPSVDASFAALARETWTQFLRAFPAHTACIGSVTLAASYALEDRAAYDPATATVTVSVPGTPALLQSALVHEWAHHLEHRCPDHERLRPAFLAAQGLPATTPWFAPARAGTAAWAAAPSEQYAETAIELVLGRRALPTTAPVSQAGLDVLAGWAAGR